MNNEKQKFIGEYLDKKMKNHGLTYGIAYLSKLANAEEEAEKKWNKKVTKNSKLKNNDTVNRKDAVSS